MVNIGVEVKRTQIHEAAKFNNNSKVIFALINSNADIFVTNNKGENIFDIIKIMKNLNLLMATGM